MKQEDKELLLKDICARLPYGVKFKVADGDTRILDAVEFCIITGQNKLSFGLAESTIEKNKVMPYLRPLSSMTDNEKNELLKYTGSTIDKEIDFYNSNHFDYRGLIPKSLALEAPEGMYNNISK